MFLKVTVANHYYTFLASQSALGYSTHINCIHITDKSIAITDFTTVEEFVLLLVAESISTLPSATCTSPIVENFIWRDISFSPLICCIYIPTTCFKHFNYFHCLLLVTKIVSIWSSCCASFYAAIKLIMKFNSRLQPEIIWLPPTMYK